jgi:hypothetical protein
MDGARDVPQVILGLGAEIDDAEIGGLLIDEVLQFLRLDQDPGRGFSPRGRPSRQMRPPG